MPTALLVVIPQRLTLSVATSCRRNIPKMCLSWFPRRNHLGSLKNWLQTLLGG